MAIGLVLILDRDDVHLVGERDRLARLELAPGEDARPSVEVRSPLSSCLLPNWCRYFFGRKYCSIRWRKPGGGRYWLRATLSGIAL